MEEQLVLSKTAILAKEKKFNISCRYCTGDNVQLPTQTLLQRWIRETHGIHIVIIPTVTSFWTYKTVTVISDRDDDVIKGIKSVSDLPPYKEVCGYDFNTYEDALEDALFEALKLIKQ